MPSSNKAQLLAIWADKFSKDPPPNLRKELMVPILAYRICTQRWSFISVSQVKPVDREYSLCPHCGSIYFVEVA